MNGGFQERAKNRKMKRKGGKWKIMVSLKKSELKKKINLNIGVNMYVRTLKKHD